MARKALMGVTEVTQTANDIANGALDRRVDVKKRSAEIDKLARVFNGMLDISEAEAGLGELSIEKVNLNKLILEACEFLRPMADEKNISIRTHLPDIIAMDADKNKLQRMVTNLLENAIKYSLPEGIVTISVTRGGNRVDIVFGDTGVGIPEKELPYIFDRFFRGDKSRSQAGFGLGLSMVKAFSKALKGSVEVSSTPDRGSTFTVSLPT